MLPWVTVAFVLYLVVFIITGGINVPRNNMIKSVDPDRTDELAAVRERFGEATWVRWNLVRTLLSLVGFGCLTLGLLQVG